MPKKKRNIFWNIPKEKKEENYLKAILFVLLAIFVVLIFFNKQDKPIQVTVSNEDIIQCHINDTSGGEFKMLFQDWNDLKVFQELSNTTFDTCRDIKDYPQYLYY